MDVDVEIEIKIYRYVYVNFKMDKSLSEGKCLEITDGTFYLK